MADLVSAGVLSATSLYGCASAPGVIVCHDLAADLERLRKERDIIGDVRRMGLFLAFEFVGSKQTRKPAPDLTVRVSSHCQQDGPADRPRSRRGQRAHRPHPPAAHDNGFRSKASSESPGFRTDRGQLSASPTSLPMENADS